MGWKSGRPGAGCDLVYAKRAESFADRVKGFTGLDSRFPKVCAARAWLCGVPRESWRLDLFMVCALGAVPAAHAPRP